MGFFSELKRNATNVKRATFRAVGKAIEKIGDVVGSIDISVVGMTIQWDNEKIKKPVDLESETTSVEDTIDVFRACEDARVQASRQSKLEEDKLCSSISNEINNFVEELKEVFPDKLIKELDYSIGKEFVDDIHNTVSDYIAKSISADSNEFVSILKINDDSKRTKEINIYIENVILRAVNKLKDKAKYRKISIYEKMCEDLDDYLISEKNSIDETINRLNGLSLHKDDLEYYEKEAVTTIVDSSYMETIRALTYN